MPRYPAGYRPRPLPTVPTDIAACPEPAFLGDVQAAFARLHDIGCHLGCWDGDGFGKFCYTDFNIGRRNEVKNHFQGIQRLHGKNGKYAVVSGGDVGVPASHLFVLRFESRPMQGPWGSNLLTHKKPAVDDRVVAVIGLESRAWHAGGMALLGDVLAVPLEGEDQYRVLFLDLSDPRAPRRFQAEVRGHVDKAGACALTRLPDGRYLLLVYREKSRRPKGRYDWYVSQTDDLNAGFGPCLGTTVHEVLADGRDPQYQNVAFIASTPGSSTFYMLATENDCIAAPLRSGTDWADLYRVEVPASLQDGHGSSSLPMLERVSSRRFFARDDHANFRAATGVYVDENWGLGLYSTYHWRVENRLRATEYRECGCDRGRPVVDLNEAWIELYEDTGFRGRRLPIFSNRHADLRAYDKIFVQGGTFNDRVLSARWHLPPGCVYRLYRDKDFRLERPGHAFDLVGGASVREVADLRQVAPEVAGEVSSSRYIVPG